MLSWCRNRVTISWCNCQAAKYEANLFRYLTLASDQIGNWRLGISQSWNDHSVFASWKRHSNFASWKDHSVPKSGLSLVTLVSFGFDHLWGKVLYLSKIPGTCREGGFPHIWEVMSKLWSRCLLSFGLPVCLVFGSDLFPTAPPTIECFRRMSVEVWREIFGLVQFLVHRYVHFSIVWGPW